MQAASIPDSTGGVRAGQTALLAFSDGQVFAGKGFGAQGLVAGELVFNTAMTGYQEILSDPSYAGQLITFTFPHIGNTGANAEDIEADRPAARGLVVRSLIGHASNWRQRGSLAAWCANHALVGIAGLDTRRITNLLRDRGAQNAAIGYRPDQPLDADEVIAAARAFGGLSGLDLVPQVTSTEPADWREADWRPEDGYRQSPASGPHIVVIEYGIKRNSLRMLAELNCRLTVMPAQTPAETILAAAPDAIVLSNGPGDPAATGAYAVPEIRRLLASGKPLMGICLGHQMLGLALGARTEKMPFGHHGANHPVLDIQTGKVEITSQNHGFAVCEADMPDSVDITHRSLFDGTVQGIALKGKPVYSVQYHPEDSPGPTDSRYLFSRLLEFVQKA